MSFDTDNADNLQKKKGLSQRALRTQRRTTTEGTESTEEGELTTPSLRATPPREGNFNDQDGRSTTGEFTGI